LEAVTELVNEFMKDYRLAAMFPHMSQLIPTYLGENLDKVCVFNERGIAAFEKVPDLSVARIALIYIRPEYRGQGLMEEFLDAFEKWGWNAGCKYYVLGVSTGADLTKRGYSVYEVMFMKEVK
jgi:GNAT superfamily N-acetyltransferase